jgi:carboxylesterase
MDAFVSSGSADWIASAEQSFESMRATHETVSIVGLSMGAALAVILAGKHHHIQSLVLIAPYLGMPRLLRFLAGTHKLWGRFAGEVNARDPRSIRDPIEREKNLAYGKVTGSTLSELAKVVRTARRGLAKVTAPTLIIQSRDDPRVAPEVARLALEKLGSADKKLVWTEGAGHIITVDYGREVVFSGVEKWLTTHAGDSAAAAQGGSTAESRDD